MATRTRWHEPSCIAAALNSGITGAPGASLKNFWSTHAGAEVDFVWRRGDRLIGFEARWGDAPAMTKSMHIALSDLGLAALHVVYPGPHRYRLDRRVEVIPIGQLRSVLPTR